METGKEGSTSFKTAQKWWMRCLNTSVLGQVKGVLGLPGINELREGQQRGLVEGRSG